MHCRALLALRALWHCPLLQAQEEISPAALHTTYGLMGLEASQATKLTLRFCSGTEQPSWSSAASMILSFPICEEGIIGPPPQGCHKDEKMR